MAVLCPKCDFEPDSHAPMISGEACPRCGTRLIGIASGEPPDELIGATIDGRFVVMARIGRGGMGTVYRARQTSMDREVALKVIDVEMQHDVGAVKRFFREAQLASQLAHPNTVSVIEFGQDPGGRMYLAMELVRGETLAAVARRDHALPVERVVRIGVQLCDALEAAHRLGIIHRDLKLENIMVLEGGRDLVKVLDFGLARSLLEGGPRATATGMIAGTPRYLSPEVALQNAPPAPAQDIYALGVILGELASGFELWSAPTMEELFAHKAFHGVTLVGVTPALEALVQRMLVSDPAARPTPAAVRSALLAVDPGRRATPEDPPKALTPAGVLGIGPTDAAFPQIRPSALVSLDHRGSPPGHRAQAAPAAAPEPLPESPSRIAARFGEEPPPPALEMEAEWSAAREAKQSAATAALAPPPPPPRPFPWGAVVAVLAVVGLGSAGVYAWQHRHRAVIEHPAPTSTTMVSIHVTASDPVDVRVDGARVGKTPLTLEYTRGSPRVIISAEIDGHPVARQITPDRDQTVALEPDPAP